TNTETDAKRHSSAATPENAQRILPSLPLYIHKSVPPGGETGRLSFSIFSPPACAVKGRTFHLFYYNIKAPACQYRREKGARKAKKPPAEAGGGILFFTSKTRGRRGSCCTGLPSR